MTDDLLDAMKLAVSAAGYATGGFDDSKPPSASLSDIVKMIAQSATITITRVADPAWFEGFTEEEIAEIRSAASITDCLHRPGTPEHNRWVILWSRLKGIDDEFYDARKAEADARITALKDRMAPVNPKTAEVEAILAEIEDARDLGVMVFEFDEIIWQSDEPDQPIQFITFEELASSTLANQASDRWFTLFGYPAVVASSGIININIS